MKNTLKVTLIVIGAGFLLFSLVKLLNFDQSSSEDSRQLYGMLGVGLLFILGGFAMGKR